MHEKYIIIRFEIVVFSVMGPSSLNGLLKNSFNSVAEYLDRDVTCDIGVLQ